MHIEIGWQRQRIVDRTLNGCSSNRGLIEDVEQRVVILRRPT
jgi:hypothetical protein